jgi:hypothetical protein
MKTLVRGSRRQMSLKMMLQKRPKHVGEQIDVIIVPFDAYFCFQLHLNSAQTSPSFVSRLQTVANSAAGVYVVESVLFIQCKYVF